MKLFSWILFFLIFILIFECEDNVLPKPKAMLRLEFPEAEYKVFDNQSCAYYFELNNSASVKNAEECSLVIEYPMMKGSVYITYKQIGNNLDTLLVDAQKLSYEHVVKADNILEQPFINTNEKVYGMFYEVTGNAASQSQFYVTDSINHFVTGSVYFYAKPNYDSILPAAAYLQQDVRRIMESLKWNQN